MEQFDSEFIERIKDGDGRALAELMSSLNPLVKSTISSCPEFDLELFKDIIRLQTEKVAKKYDAKDEMDVIDFIELNFSTICKKSFYNYFLKKDYSNLFALLDDINEKGYKKSTFIKFVFKMSGYSCNDSSVNKILNAYRSYIPGSKMPSLNIKIVKDTSDKKIKEIEEPKQPKANLGDMDILDLAEKARNGSDVSYEQLMNSLKETVLKKYLSMCPTFDFALFKSIVKNEVLQSFYSYNEFGSQSIIEYLESNFRQITKKTFREYFFNDKYKNMFKFFTEVKEKDLDNTLKFIITISGYKYDKNQADRIIQRYKEYASKNKAKIKEEKEAGRLEAIKEVKKKADIQKKEEVHKTGIDLIEIFKDFYQNEEIEVAVKTLKDKQRNLIYKYCGFKLNGIGGKRLNKEEQDYNVYVFEVLCDNLIEKFGNRMKGHENNLYYEYMANTKYAKDVTLSSQGKRKPSYKENSNRKRRDDLISYYESKYTLEQLKEIIDSENFTKKYGNIVYTYCGQELNGIGGKELSKEEHELFHCAFDCIKRQIESRNKPKGKKAETKKTERKKRKYYINLVEYFDNNFTSDELKIIISSIFSSENDRQLFFIYNGPNLDGKDKGDLLPEQKVSYKLLLSKLKRSISKIEKINEYKNLIEALENKVTKEELDELVGLLNNEEKSLLLDICGVDYKGTNNIELEKYNETFTVLEKVYTKAKVVYEERFDEAISYGIKSNLIAYLNYKFSCEELKQIIHTDVFSVEQRKIIYLYCGEKLNGKIFSNLTKDEYCTFNNNITKICRILNYFPESKVGRSSSRKPINLILKLGNVIDRREIQRVVDLFEENEQNQIYNIFGRTYDGKPSSYINNARKYTNEKLSKILINRLQIVYSTKFNKKIIYGRASNLIGYLKNVYTKSEIESVIKRYSEEDQLLIYKYCGDNLDGLTLYEPTEEESIRIKRLINNITNAMRSKIGLKDKKPSIDLMELTNNKLTKEELDRIIDLFSTDEAQDIRYVIGPNYDGKDSELLKVGNYTKVKNNIKRIVYKAQIVYIDKFYIKGENTKPRGFRTNLIALLEYKYTKEQIEEALNNERITPSQKAIVLQIAGPTFDGLTLQESDTMAHNLYANTIKKLINILDPNRVMDRTPQNNLIAKLNYSLTKEEIDRVVDLIPEEIRQYIYKKYGRNYDGKVENENIVISIKLKNELQEKMQIVIERLHIVYPNKFNLKVVRGVYCNLIAFLDYSKTKEEIEEVVKKFNETDRNLIYKYCGKNFDGLVIQELTPEDLPVLRNLAIKIKGRFKPKQANSRRTPSDLMALTKNILTKQELDKIIDLFSPAAKEDIKNLIGPNYDGTNSNLLEVKDFVKAKKYVQFISNKARIVYVTKFKTLTDEEITYGIRSNLIAFLDNKYTRDQILEVLNSDKFKPKNKEAILIACGPNLDGLTFDVLPKSKRTYFNRGIDTLIKILEPERLVKKTPSKATLLPYKSKYSIKLRKLKMDLKDKEFIEIVDVLDVSEQETLIHYMECMEINLKIDGQELTNARAVVLKFVSLAKTAYPLKFNISLDKASRKNLLAYFGYKYSYEQLKYIIENADYPQEFRNLIYKNCGYKLNGLTQEKLNRAESLEYSKAVLLIMERLNTISEDLLVKEVTRVKVTKIDSIDIDNSLKEEVTNIENSLFYKSVISSNFTKEEAIIISGYTGYATSNRLTIEQIATLFNIDVVTAKTIINETLCKYKSYINSKIEKHILELHN